MPGLSSLDPRRTQIERIGDWGAPDCKENLWEAGGFGCAGEGGSRLRATQGLVSQGEIDGRAHQVISFFHFATLQSDRLLSILLHDRCHLTFDELHALSACVGEVVNEAPPFQGIACINSTPTIQYWESVSIWIKAGVCR